MKLNWTIAQAGTNRNVIPGQATADARALRVADFDALARTLEEKSRNKLLPESKVSVKFEVRRPPLEATAASRALASHGVAIYRAGPAHEGGGPRQRRHRHRLRRAEGARPGHRGHGPVRLRRPLNEAEYIQIGSIVPRLYLSTRMIMDVSQGKAPLK